MIPTILFLNGFRFFFYSNENNEPAHIHVRKGSGEGKIWLEPTMQSAWFVGFTKQEESMAVQIAGENEQLFKTKWNEYFAK